MVKDCEVTVQIDIPFVCCTTSEFWRASAFWQQVTPSDSESCKHVRALAVLCLI